MRPDRFSIVFAHPSSSKRALKGELRSEDIGITVHTMQDADADAQYVVVDTTPLVYDAFAKEEVPCDCLALVMSCRSMHLDQLRQLRAWRTDSELMLSLLLDSTCGSGRPLIADKLALFRVMNLLVTAGTGGADISSVGMPEPAQKIIDTMVAAGLTIHRIVGGQDRWLLTDKGRAELRGGVRLRSHVPVLQCRDLPAEELSKYELLMRLEELGFALRIADSDTDVKEARKFPYRAGSPKVWWLRGGKGFEDLSARYMILLVTAHVHGKDVPHLQQAKVYHQLIDPEWRPRKKREKVIFVDEDAWVVPDEHSKRAAVKKPKAKAKAKAAAIDALRAGGDFSSSSAKAASDSEGSESEASNGGGSGHESRARSAASSRGKSGSRAGSGSSKRSSSSSSSSSSGLKDGPTRELPADPAAASKEEVPAAIAVPKVAPAAGAAANVRDRWNSEPFGACTLTARCGATGIVGWQMTCTNPRHRFPRAKCIREMSACVMKGDLDVVRRCLKSWVLLGAGLATQDEHMAPALKQTLIDACVSGSMLDDAELDRLAIWILGGGDRLAFQRASRRRHSGRQR